MSEPVSLGCVLKRAEQKMDGQAVVDELKNIVCTYLKGQGLDIVELIYRYEGRDLVLKALVDRPEGGISLGECAQLNMHISAILDEGGIIKTPYILEVSSPGLDRPLKTRSDFLRCVRKKVRVFLNAPVAGRIEYTGFVSQVMDDSVCIDANGIIIEIPLPKVIKAKQVLDNI